MKFSCSSFSHHFFYFHTFNFTTYSTFMGIYFVCCHVIVFISCISSCVFMHLDIFPLIFLNQGLSIKWYFTSDSHKRTPNDIYLKWMKYFNLSHLDKSAYKGHKNVSKLCDQTPVYNPEALQQCSPKQQWPLRISWHGATCSVPRMCWIEFWGFLSEGQVSRCHYRFVTYLLINYFC